ncbi:MAG: NPCBM/NEW2 domain-containing protein, partial [Ruminococcus sp.]|nr:NPCBM/NEW2 domain-containing protein [Ruminococcus sp.]
LSRRQRQLCIRDMYNHDYYIQGKYTTFSGIVAVPNGNENDDRSAFFDIYGDGNLLYTSSIMTNTSFPESFSIDITDVQLLTISYPDSNTKSEMATIYDGVLST